MERPPEQLQGTLRVIRLLHVDAYERSIVASLGDDRPEVLDAQPLVDGEPHLGELHRDVRIRAGAANAVERLEISVPRGARFGRTRHRFAQQIEARPDASGVEPREGGHGGFDRFARDEAGGKAAGETVPPNDAEQARLLAEPQETGAEHRGRWSGIRGQGSGVRGQRKTWCRRAPAPAAPRTERSAARGAR